jgi:formimidoylglutamate deiminase
MPASEPHEPARTSRDRGGVDAAVEDTATRCLWAPEAWIDGRWQRAVRLDIDASGRWAAVTPGVHSAPAQATIVDGALLPGLVDAHSHAFQRAFAGLAERIGANPNGAADDFWSWRDRMYGVALRITPEQLGAIAAQLYVELLRGGYTQVCEFHYLQHAEDGSPYADPATLSWALADAAGDAGIGLTVLPVLYERAGFDAPALRADQRRFASSPESVDALHRAISAARRPLVNAGVAIHSLRAAAPRSIAALLEHVGDADVPIHIHIAEQTREVDDCVAATGLRPIEWLCREVRVDARWQLVHATHATPSEIDATAASGAGIVLCPSTEANLGDGLADLPRWLESGVPIALGSDSQVTRQWPEELRWLEYGQRLTRRRRNVAAGSTAHRRATAANLFERVRAGSGPSAGLARWGLVPGARADALVVDLQAPGVLGVPASHRLDALVFATDAPPFRAVYVGGRRVIDRGRHAQQAEVEERFSAAMAELWSESDRSG